MQLANSVIRAIKEGKIQEEQIMPSINELSFEFDISRDTAEKGYKYLKTKGVLQSVPGKGYFINKLNLEEDPSILLLFNKLSRHKKTIYDAFINALEAKASVDLYIYDNDFQFFKRILTKITKPYNYYVILPHFKDNHEKAFELINSIPKEKLVLMDHLVPGITGDFGAVYEDFEHDIYTSLEKALPHLKKYKQIKLLIPTHDYYPNSIVKGFSRFCTDHQFNHKIIHSLKNEPIIAGQLYITVIDDDLVQLVEKVLCTTLEVGKDIGIISYNENPLKKIILNGITTISTDFVKMGQKTASMIINKQKYLYKVPFEINFRPSL